MAYFKKHCDSDRFSEVEDVLRMRASLFISFNQLLGSDLLPSSDSGTTSSMNTM
jgi:hypothetical protein